MSKYTSTYLKLADFGKELLYKKSLVEGLPHISKYAKDVIGADRCSIFIYDEYKKELWTTLSDGVEKIVIDSTHGLVGQTIRDKKPILENDVYSNPNFSSTIDKDTGYKTKNVITAPIFNSKREIIGVLQLLNKDDGFDNEDAKFMVFFTHYISGFLELINLYTDK
ncbi:MAG: GAF domain-containing protein [Sulfurimonas sp.]|nr:GAF domain-containing protein [Sulfurimonas sp.]